MKVAEKITLRNLRAFDFKGVLLDGQSSYFEVQKGEDLSVALKAHKFTEDEVADVTMRILKGNPSWIFPETSDDKEKVSIAIEEKKVLDNRKNELFSWKRNEQIDFLLKLGADKSKIPHSEADRINLIIEMEGKR